MFTDKILLIEIIIKEPDQSQLSIWCEPRVVVQVIKKADLGLVCFLFPKFEYLNWCHSYFLSCNIWDKRSLSFCNQHDFFFAQFLNFVTSENKLVFSTESFGTNKLLINVSVFQQNITAIIGVPWTYTSLN